MNDKKIYKLNINNLVPIVVVIIFLIISSEKYGYLVVAKGMGVFLGILFFNLASVRLYQEICFFFKREYWDIDFPFSLLLVSAIFVIPFVFFTFLSKTYYIIGTVLTIGVLGALLVYELIRKIFS